MHNIMEHDKQQGRSMAWHGLTEVVEALALATCWLTEWDVLPQVLQVNGNDTPFRVLTATDKPDLIIGQAYDPDSYKPVTNKRLLAQVATALEGEQDVALDSVVSIRNRCRVALSFELGQSYKAAGREFRGFLNIGNSHDKSSPLWVNTSNICTVCDNTFSMNMAAAGRIFGVKHTKMSEPKIGRLSDVLSAALELQKAFAANLDRLTLVKCNVDDCRALLAGWLGTPKSPLSTRSENVVERIVALYGKGAGNSGRDLADVFQAVTDYYTHEAASAAADAAAKWKNFVSSEYGNGAESKTEFWNVLLNADKRAALMGIGKDVLIATLNAKAAKV
jgi:hypothetical protein